MIKWMMIGALAVGSLCGETIEDKLAACASGDSAAESSMFLAGLNDDLEKLREELAISYGRARRAYEQNWDVATHLEDINALKAEIRSLEAQWRRMAREEASRGEEGYGLWDQEESTIGQLVMEYGSSDYLYIIPPDIMKQKISLHSGIPIPRQSWNELLELVLSQSGIGIKELSPLVRQLYAFKSDLLGVKSVLTRREDLKLYRGDDRVIFVFSPQSEDSKSVFYFLERFRDQKRTHVHQTGNKIAVISTCEEIEKLLALYDAVWEEGQKRTTKVISLSKLGPKEMEKILKAYFGVATDDGRMSTMKGGAHIKILPIEQEGALALVGMKDVVERAENMIRETENQIEDPLEMTVFWYTCRHSNPKDLAEVLDGVYSSLINSNVEGAKNSGESVKKPEKNQKKEKKEKDTSPVIDPPAISAARVKKDDDAKKTASKNFIASPKTGAIMMVVRRDVLPKLKDLLKKLDVPKKMVQIEVLILEKRSNARNHMGMNVLKMGSNADGKHRAGVGFEQHDNLGILDFFIHRKASKYLPDVNLGYKFLMGRDDIKINAAPTITTVNQTPATIAVMEERSIDQGALGDKTKSSYVRQQYGISLVITPTIHEMRDDDETKYSITLDTKISFDQPQDTGSTRPNVDRSSIENLVDVVDGETWVLGGLRSKVTEDSHEKIPFLGEIPGVAKFFGTSKLSDRVRELVIFITPRVIESSHAAGKRLREESLGKRAGDLPEYVIRLEEAQNKKKSKRFRESFDLMFGEGHER